MTMQVPRLYSYFRSGAAHRVRIALALKGIAFETFPVHLVRNEGEHLTAAFRALNPQARLPVYELSTGETLIQSPAILEYLEETVPEPPLLPAGLIARAKVRGVAALSGCDVHPLNNVAVLATLRHLGHDESVVSAWIAQWITAGFNAVEQLIGDTDWCFGPTPSLADIYLVPQIFSADRFGVRLEPYPRITRVSAMAADHPAFTTAAPGNQPDAS